MGNAINSGAQNIGNLQLANGQNQSNMYGSIGGLSAASPPASSRRHATDDRARNPEGKLAARENKPGFRANVEAIKQRIAELEAQNV
jgi:hypothetical protein